MEKAKFLMSDALEADEGGSKEEAVKLYTTAVEFCLDAVSQRRILNDPLL